MIKKVSYIFLIIAISGLSGIFADRYLFPHLSSTEFFSKYEFLKKSTEDVTVINKTEQVYVKEESSISKIADGAASSVVNIVSYSDTAETSITIGNASLRDTFSQNAEIRNGTGVIATSDGIIMTYLDSIIPENARYKVLTAGGGSYDAEIWSRDSYSNLVFLKINAGNLPAISFGNSDEAAAGEKVVAIGNNLGNYQNRYYLGLLNGFDPAYNLSGKTVSHSDKLEGVFRSDFSAQDGCVGGPMVDFSGQVIGLTGSIEKDNEIEYFQIPSNKVKQILERAIRKESDKNFELGVYFQPLTKSHALANGLETQKGALVYAPSGQQGLTVMAGSVAQKAGLRIGDVIAKVNGEEVNETNTLPDLLYKYKKGDKIELSVIRNGSGITVDLE